MTPEQKLARELRELGMDGWQFHEAAHDVSSASRLAHRVACGLATLAEQLELAAVLARIQRPPAPDARCGFNQA